MKSLLVFAATILVSVQTAIGQVRTVSDLRFTLDEWEFVPTLIGTQVESFVALRDPDQAVGDNVTAVWFLRIDDRDWQTYAWHDQDNLKAVAHIKGTLELDDSTDASWPVAEAQQGVDVTEATEPDQFGTGVFEDDPFAPIIESLPEPGVLIESLDVSGWSAARISIWTEVSDCTQDEILSTLAAIVEADIATGAGGALVAGFTVPQTKCDEWISLSMPLGPDGTWAVTDLAPHLEAIASIDPADAWQSVVPGTIYEGPQTIVIEAGGVDASGQQYTSNQFVVTLKDRTPPTIEVELFGNDSEPLTSPGGLKYFQPPVTITANVVAADNVDGQMASAPDPEIDIYVDCQVLIDAIELTAPGYYTLRVRASDSAGNTSYYSELFEVRKNLNLEAAAAIESSSVTPIGANDLVEATVYLTSEQVDPCVINLATFSLWLLDGDGQQVATAPLRMSPGYTIGGAYNLSMADFDLCVWRLAVQGEVPAGAMSIPGLQFVVTGSGLHGDPGTFDFISRKQPFVAQADAQTVLLNEVNPDCDCGDPPPPPPPPPCEWKSQFIPDDPPVDDFYSTPPPETCVYENCAGLEYAIFAAPNTFMGAAYAWEWCPTFCGLKQEEDKTVASGGTLKVWLEGEDCCDDCEIDVSARPRFRASAAINPRATAGAAGELAVAIPGCGQVIAAGGAAVSSVQEGTFGFSSPYGGVSIPYVTQDTMDSDVPSAQSACEPYPHCSIQINVSTKARIEVIAESTVVWGAGEALANLWDAVMRLTVTPHADDSCGPVIDDDVPIDYDDCNPWVIE